MHYRCCKECLYLLKYRLLKTPTRGGAAAARMAHNHEVAGSSPAPATRVRRQLLQLSPDPVFVARPLKLIVSKANDRFG